MAEYCFDCWTRIHKKKQLPDGYELSRDLDFCEGCGEWKRVVERREWFSTHPYFIGFVLLYELVLELVYFIKRSIQKRKRGKLK